MERIKKGKRIMKFFKFIISIALTVSIISPHISFAFAEAPNVVFDGQFYKITEADDDYQVLDKENNRSVDLIAENGKISEVKFNDGTVVTPSQKNTKASVKRIGVPIPKGVDPSRLTYHYLDTIYTNTHEISNYKAFWTTIAGFIPPISAAVQIVSFLDSVRSLNNNKVVYLKTNRYYANGYMYYKYVTYAYKDSARKKLIKKKTVYIKMF